jgi:hypothetical protein
MLYAALEGTTMSTGRGHLTRGLFIALGFVSIVLGLYTMFNGSAECPSGNGASPLCIPLIIAEKISPGEATATLVAIFLGLTTLFFHMAFGLGKKDKIR